MLSVETKERLDYNKFDDMSTEALKTVLQADFDTPEAEQMDVDTIMYITNLLTERKKAYLQNSVKDVADAKAEFYKEYYPLKDNKELVRDIIGDVDKEINFSRKLDKPVKFYKKVASMVAAILIVFCVGSVTAYAFGYNPFAAIGRWNNEQFWFEKTLVTQELANKLAEYDNSLKLVPKWLPDYFMCENIEVINRPDGVLIGSSFIKSKNDEIEHIGINYIQEIQDSQAFYEKIDEEPVEYLRGSIKHYILFNSQNTCITWLNGNFECSIIGKFSVDEAKKIIDSIYEE